MSNKNPLLSDYTLPPFDAIKPAHVIPALEQILTQNRALIDEIAAQTAPTWDSVISPLEAAEDQLHRVWSPVCHLHAVADSAALRKAYHEGLPKITAYYSEIGQHSGLYQIYQTLHDSPEFNDYDLAQKQVIQNALRDFHLSGVDLSVDQKKILSEKQKNLSKLTSQYSDNILDTTKAWTKQVTDEAVLSGLPARTLAAARKKAEEKQLEGWVLTLDFPCYDSVMRYAHNRSLRECFYKAYSTRGSTQGDHNPDFDNTAIMQTILEERQALAELLGFKNYADYSLSTKMADSTDEVMDFLQTIINKAKPAATAELAALTAFATEYDGMQTLAQWDLAFYTEKQRQKKYSLDQDRLREYFPLTKVFTGLFEIVKKLYRIDVIEEPVTAWEKSVKLFAVYDKDKQLRGRIYMDLFARDNKRGGAWMDECLVRYKHHGQLQHPVAYLVCNFNAPIEDKPTLLTHEEVETLLHEFGHCLHHILTQVDYADVSGINGVAWDAVELPSQFMENFAWHKDSLPLLCAHYKTGESLPDVLLENILASKHYHSAMHLMRQMTFALFDFTVHLNTDMPKSHAVAQTLTQVQAQTALMPVLPYNRFTHAFTHIFAGGYAAGYYSYAWADVLAADAFDCFLKAGIFDPKLGKRFLQCILEKGGSKPAQDLFIDFCGHKPRVEALLKARDIL